MGPMRRNYSLKSLDELDLIKDIHSRSYVVRTANDLQPLFERIADARIVMLGEASHGTHEYYTWRSLISKKLITEKGFNCIAVEGDWPDCYRLNRFIKGYDTGNKTAFDVLHGFDRWPTWMWANWEVVALANWLQQYNSTRMQPDKVGFYGLDVYSLWASMESIMQYLGKNDPSALKSAEEAFRCFEPYRNDEGRSYARASQFVPDLCKEEVVTLLKELQEKLPEYGADYENSFSTEQNAFIAVNAEKYYRAMIEGGPGSWNIRDQHMADSLERIMQFLGNDSKVIVWEHNTHIGDARATDMLDDGMFNIGELARKKYGETNVVLVGFGSYQGTVMAAQSWGAEMKTMKLPAARSGSWEDLLHRSGDENKLLIMEDFMSNAALLENHIGHRAVGVVYHPQREQYGNYVPTILPLRYDAFIYIDQTKAVHPLHVKPDRSQTPETYPFGM